MPKSLGQCTNNGLLPALDFYNQKSSGHIHKDLSFPLLARSIQGSFSNLHKENLNKVPGGKILQNSVGPLMCQFPGESQS